MGETRVDLHHLLEDLRDAYPGGTEETILTEIIANALDSGAGTVAVTTHPSTATLAIVDDGSGMRRRELARYHDIAATTKTRGAGIGFAGVGIKIALLVCQEVVTETRREGKHIATAWHLASRNRAPWHWVEPPGLVAARGTAVRLRPTNPLSPLLDAGFVEATLRRCFQPLLDPAFDEILAAHYPRGVRLVVNGEALEREGPRVPETVPIAVRLARKRKPAVAGHLVRDRVPLAEERRGVAISTFGKVIRRGWEWLGLTPATPDHVGGLVEAPALAECLTLNKADFIRSGARGATYLAYRKAIQEAVSRQLEAWGDTPAADERARRRAARPMERDLEAVLADLADDFPLLATLVERRSGGQRRLPIGRGETGAPEMPGGPLFHSVVRRAESEAQEGEGPLDGERAERQAAGERAPAPAVAEAGVEPTKARRQPSRYGLTIQFEDRPDDPEVARLVESTVWVNAAHPAYRRAVASRSEGYHVALATGMALATLAVEPAKEHAFLTAFLAAWGEAVERRTPRDRAARRTRRRGGDP